MLERGIKLLPLQGVTNERALTQGVASLALGYALLGFQPVHYRRQNYAIIYGNVHEWAFAKGNEKWH